MYDDDDIDITPWGTPENRDYRFPIRYHVYPSDLLPFPYIEPGTLDVAIFLLYLLFAILYAFDFPGFLPRTHGHDLIVAAGMLPALFATAPFALDFYLMFGRLGMLKMH
jgi:hypothetical protein